MCNAFVQNGLRATLFAKRSIKDDKELLSTLRQVYGVELSDFRLVTFYGGNGRADSLKIAILALVKLLRTGTPDLIVSRNLYASFILAVLFRKSLIFETHQLEFGFRKRMQRAITCQAHVLTLVISQRLIAALESHLGVKPAHRLVLHDAAPAGIKPISKEARSALREEWATVVGRPLQPFVCGYFGHLYPGRGIEIIQKMALVRPEVTFLVFGGNEGDIASHKEKNRVVNLHYMGFISHGEVLNAMASVDLLLMPYQAEVSIGVKNHDTAGWMSPMKMFEYMAVQVPFVASRLPALEEVLVDESNCLLAEPDNAADWIACLDRLIARPAERKALAAQAYLEYRQEYNWVTRAKKMLEAVHLCP